MADVSGVVARGGNWSWLKTAGRIVTIGAVVIGTVTSIILTQGEHQVPSPIPPPSPPPAGEGECDPTATFDYGELREACKTLALAQGRRITINNPANTVRCQESLLSETGDTVVPGTWPVYIHITFTGGSTPAQDPIWAYDPGCQGDGNPNTIDLVLEIEGDGVANGGQNDAMKARTTANAPGGLQITGYASCGPKAPAAHQDVLQLQGGNRLELYDFVLGGTPDDFEDGIPRCQGAGGAYFISGANGNVGTNMLCDHCAMIACNHTILGADAGSSGVIRDSVARGFTATSQWPAGTCPGTTAAVGACSGGPPWSGYTVTNLNCDNFPFDSFPP